MTRTALLCVALLPALALAAGAATPQYYNEVYTFSNGGGAIGLDLKDPDTGLPIGTGNYGMTACIGQPVAGSTWKLPPPPPSEPDWVIVPDNWPDKTRSESYFVPAFFPTPWHLDLFEGYNLIAMPQKPDRIYNASDLLQEISNQGGNATRVLMYNGNGYDFYTSTGGGTNFLLRPGVGYFVRCSVDSRWTMQGYPFARPSSAIVLESGYNLIGLNISASPAYTASAVLSEINEQPPGNATRVLMYNGNGYDFYTSTGGGTNFTLRLGEGYFIRVSTDSTWTLSNQ